MKKYIQLYQELKDAIAAGEHPPQTQLPTEAELSERYGVSRQTVRQALALLRDEGVISSVRGSGSFVSPAGTHALGNKRIAVITTYFSEYIFPSILRGISQTAVDNGYTLELNSTNNSITLEKNILTGIMQNPVAGIIVEGTKSALPNPNAVYYQRLREAGVPVVFINSIYSQLEGGSMVSVAMDDYAGGYDVARHVIGMGHRRIGCIFKSDDKQGIQRFAGVMSALSDSSVDFDDRCFIWFTTETKHSFINTLLASRIFSDCTALICYNDEVVELLSSYLEDTPHGIRAIGSFDQNLNKNLLPDGIDYYSPAHRKEELGKLAAHKLFNLLSGRSETSAVLDWLP